MVEQAMTIVPMANNSKSPAINFVVIINHLLMCDCLILPRSAA